MRTSVSRLRDTWEESADRGWRVVVKREPSMIVSRARLLDFRVGGAFYIVSAPRGPEMELYWLGEYGWEEQIRRAQLFDLRRTAADVGVGAAPDCSVTIWACQLDVEEA